MDVVMWAVVLLLVSSTVTQTRASSWTAEVPSSVRGLLGSCVFIPCSYNYPDPGKTLSDFTGIWTKETNHIIYHPVQSKVMQQFRNRTELLGDLRRNDCSLKINPLQATDTGPFHFRIEIADFDKYSFKAAEVTIRVTDTMDPISLCVQEEVEEGTPVSATCSASHSCPAAPPAFAWNHPGTQHFQSKELDNGQWETSSSLTFHPTHADHNTTLECSVTYEGGRHQRRSKTLKVKSTKLGMRNLYFAISVGAVVTLVIILIAVGIAKKLRRSSSNQPVPQMKDDLKALETPHQSRKWSKTCNEVRFPYDDANDHVYGNAEAEFAAGARDVDDSIYANI